GRPRTHFARGERPTLDGAIRGAHPGDVVRVTLRGPDGLAAMIERPAEPTPAAAAAALQVEVLMPPFGAAGPYRLGVVLVRGAAAVAAAETPAVLVGRTLPTPARLVIEASVVDGQGGRRVAEVTPPRLALRLRLAGFTATAAPASAPAPGGGEAPGVAVAVSATATLRTADGRPVTPATPIGAIRETFAARPARLELEGGFELRQVPSGGYLLELTATDEPSGRTATQIRHLAVP
ncbi:MAG TPA: hypothetical protein VGQ83_21660, partial [Polyangia bacterium]